MRQLLPEVADIDPVEAHASARRHPPADRPWVAVNMVASVDGATAIDGVSGGLGGPADKVVFRAIRGVADVIVAAAGTVRSEAYGPPRTSAEVQAARRARGQAAHPQLAVVSGSLDLDPDLPLFSAGSPLPAIYTSGVADEQRVHKLAAVADIRVAGHHRVDVAEVMADLFRRGARCVVVEGGPTLNGQLIAADLVDELNLTTSPMLVSGTSHRAAHGPQERSRALDLAHLWEADGQLFARYVRADAIDP